MRLKVCVPMMGKGSPGNSNCGCLEVTIWKPILIVCEDLHSHCHSLLMVPCVVIPQTSCIKVSNKNNKNQTIQDQSGRQCNQQSMIQAFIWLHPGVSGKSGQFLLSSQILIRSTKDLVRIMRDVFWWDMKGGIEMHSSVGEMEREAKKT